MQKRDQIYVDGQWVASDGDGSIDVINPSNEEVIGSVPAGTAVDVDAAVAAALADVRNAVRDLSIIASSPAAPLLP